METVNITAAEGEGLGEGLPDTLWHSSHHKLQMLLLQSNIFDCETPSYFAELEPLNWQGYGSGAELGSLKEMLDIELEAINKKHGIRLMPSWLMKKRGEMSNV